MLLYTTNTVSYGYKYAAEIVTEQIAKAEVQQKAGNVAATAEVCLGIILGAELPPAICTSEEQFLQQAKMESYALVRLLPARQHSAREFCLLTATIHLLRTGIPIDMLVTRVKCINLFRRFVRRGVEGVYGE